MNSSFYQHSLEAPFPRLIRKLRPKTGFFPQLHRVWEGGAEGTHSKTPSIAIVFDTDAKARHQPMYTL